MFSLLESTSGQQLFFQSGALVFAFDKLFVLRVGDGPLTAQNLHHVQTLKPLQH